jgi:acyl-CoA reductase-like NAD-dependent aldehyde dehydrogenase
LEAFYEERRKMTVQARNLIGGQWKATLQRASAFSPAHPRQPIGEYCLSTRQDVEEAVQKAKEALPGWRRLAGPTRGDILYRAAEVLGSHQEELARLAASEMGKPIGEARGEAQRAVAIFRYYAGEASRTVGEVIPSQRAGTLQYTVRTPVGVVAAITPWNFPLAIPAWKVAPALAYGNTVVLKPAEWSSLTAFRMVELLAALLPPGVLNLVLGLGSEAGEALVSHPQVDAITFTGSTAVGQRIAQIAVSRGAKYQLEMGGKNAVIVDEDSDLDLAVELTLSGAMRSAGQKCTATSRAIVLAPIREAFVERLVSRAQALQVGDPLDPDVYLGPVVSQRQYDKVWGYISQGQAEGARLLLGPSAPKREADQGYFIPPVIFDQVKPNMALFQEEIFGPVLSISEAENLDEAIQQANAVRYGLSASVFTRRLDTALRCVEELEAGLVRVNEETAGVELQAPFGGLKASSSHSREQGRAAMEFFTHIRTVAIRPSRMSGTP